MSKEKIEKAWELVNSKHIETNEEIQLVRYAVRTARDLVERDTPKTVIKETIKHYINTDDFYDADYYKCPCCEKIVLYEKFKKIEGYINNDDIIPELKVEIIKNILKEGKGNE